MRNTYIPKRKQRLPRVKPDVSKDEYISLLEEEIASLESKIEFLTQMHQSAVSDNESLRHQLRLSRVPNTDEAFTEYYRGEADYVELRALNHAKKCLAGSGCDRQIDVLSHLIERVENNSDALIGKDYVANVKRTSKQKVKDVKDVLKQIGFERQRTNGHSFYLWNNDSRYGTSASATPSDARTFQNELHDVYRMIFGAE